MYMSMVKFSCIILQSVVGSTVRWENHSPKSQLHLSCEILDKFIYTFGPVSLSVKDYCSIELLREFNVIVCLTNAWMCELSERRPFVCLDHHLEHC